KHLALLITAAAVALAIPAKSAAAGVPPGLGITTGGGGVPPAKQTPPAVQTQTFTVTRFDDPAPFDPATARCLPDDCTLREAVWAADENPGADTILVPAGTYKFVVHAELPITDRVTITKIGSGSEATIDADGDNTHARLFEISAPTTLNDIGVRHGNPP